MWDMLAKAIAMSVRCKSALLLGLALVVTAPSAALPHAAIMEAEVTQAIRLHAFYETGEPMSQAQVFIYAPDDPAQAWGQGIADMEGRYEFIPDAIAGRWSVQVRQAGHGVMAHLDIGADAPVMTISSTPDTWAQRALMVALVAWGALGTALFARSRKGKQDASA